MKIIKPGVLPKRVFAGKCKYCRCEIEALEKECKLRTYDNGGWGASYYDIDCPTEGC